MKESKGRITDVQSEGLSFTESKHQIVIITMFIQIYNYLGTINMTEWLGVHISWEGKIFFTQRNVDINLKKITWIQEFYGIIESLIWNVRTHMV